MSNHEEILKLTRLKIMVESAIEQLKGGHTKPLTEIEKAEHEIRYGRDAIVLGEFIIQKR
jgi:hypothetical protein